MRTQGLFLIILFSLLVSFPAVASDWERIFSDNDITLYVDKQSIKGDMTSMGVWDKEVFRKEQRTPHGISYAMRIDYLEIDCNNSTLKHHEVSFYSINGEIVDSWHNPHPNIHRIVPDSVGESVKEYVCSFKQTK